MAIFNTLKRKRNLENLLRQLGNPIQSPVLRLCYVCATSGPLCYVAARRASSHEAWPRGLVGVGVVGVGVVGVGVVGVGVVSSPARTPTLAILRL